MTYPAALALAFLLPLGGWGSEPGGRSPDPASASWSALLRLHLDRHPLATAEDVYKFAHQSVFGPAHAVPSREEARKWLEQELATLSPEPANEPVLEFLSTSPPLARVNLRPWLANRCDVDRLLDAFVTSANEVRGDPQTLRPRLEAAVATLRESGCGETADRLAELSGVAAAAGYPAVHHSDPYRQAYHPAYRVVVPNLLGDSPCKLPSSSARSLLSVPGDV